MRYQLPHILSETGNAKTVHCEYASDKERVNNLTRDACSCMTRRRTVWLGIEAGKKASVNERTSAHYFHARFDVSREGEKSRQTQTQTPAEKRIIQCTERNYVVESRGGR